MLNTLLEEMVFATDFGVWKSYGSKQIVDIQEEVNSAISIEGVELHIGTDSQHFNSKTTEYITVLVCRTPGKGGRIFYNEESCEQIKQLHQRLFKEVWKSIEFGLKLNVPKKDITIHVDVNTKQKYKSSKFMREFIGLVESQGFRVLCKPDSWAASTVADHLLKN